MNTYTPQERTQLAGALGCPEADLDATLAKFVAAAEEEYVRMILGQHVYSRGQDIRTYRLSLMIKHAFDGKLPSEGQISGLFQTTTSESRSLLRAVRAKYQYELRQAIRDTLRAAVDTATRDKDASDGPWLLECDSENIIAALNDEIARHKGSLPKITRTRGTASAYDIQNSTYKALKNEILA